MKPSCWKCIHRYIENDSYFYCKSRNADIEYVNTPKDCEMFRPFGRVFKKICKGCGEEYETTDRYQQYCSMSCARTYAYNRDMKRNRPFTKETEYLVKLWHRKGDSARTIANILNRPVEVIEGILRGDT